MAVSTVIMATLRRFKEFVGLDTRLRQFYGTWRHCYCSVQLLLSLPPSLPPSSHDSCTPQSPSPGDIGVHLPSKRPLRNMDPAFVENRQKELEQYLQVCHRPSHPHILTSSHSHTLTSLHPHTLILTPSSSHPHTPHLTQALISLPGVQSSQLLASFLTDSSDPTLFIPDSVSDKAGRQPLSISSHALTYSLPMHPMWRDFPSFTSCTIMYCVQEIPHYCE